MRELIQAKIEEKRVSLAAVSRAIGKNHAYLQQYLERGIPKRLPEDVRAELARYLGISESVLLEGVVNQRPKIVQVLSPPGHHVPPLGVTNVSPDTLLGVYGMAEGGSDGWNLFNGEIVQYIQRPENLRGAPAAYAVFITGTSMSPRYEQGEIAHIHPGRPVIPGAYVLVQRKPAHEGEPPLAVIKRLVRRSGTKVTLEQLNPKKQFDVLVDNIISIHRIVGSSEG